MDIGTDFSNCKKYVLSVLVHSRPSDLPGHRFYVVSAEILPIEIYWPRLTVTMIENVTRSADCIGVFYIAIAAIDLEIMIFQPMRCRQDTYADMVEMARTDYDNEPAAREWTQWLMELINDGVIRRN